MISFCTLFDSYYLDKGIALYKSLESVSDDFTLYVFCFDDKSFNILSDFHFSSIVLIHHSAIETPELLEKKKERSKAEYCWTCTPVVIEYVLEHFQVDSCTYIDSDLYFYSDPQILFDEIEAAGADVTIVEHRFKENRYGRKLEKRNGKYCVEFNYFKQNDNAKKVLKWWKEKCFEWCYDIPESDRMGDQKYLNTWAQDFEGVHELQYLGGGVAPWNLEQYRLLESEDGKIELQSIDGKEFSLVFYHFQNIRYLTERKVNIKSQTRNRKLKYAIYIPYLIKTEEIRTMLKEGYGLDLRLSRVVRSSNRIVSFLQRHFAAYKVRYLSDIVRLDRLASYEVKIGTNTDTEK